MKRKTRNIVGALVIVLALIGIIVSSIVSSYKYYYSVDEIKDSASLVGKEIKVAGNVKEGTVEMKKVGAGCTFLMEGEKLTLKIDYSGQVPDTFKEGIPVVIEGKLINKEEIKAYSLLTKCASRYEEKLE